MKMSILGGEEPEGSWEQYVAKCPQFSRGRILEFRDHFVNLVKEEGHDAICGFAWAIESIQAQGVGTFMFRNRPEQMEQILEALQRLPASEISEDTLRAFHHLFVLDFEMGMEALNSFIRRKAQGN